MPAKKTSKSKPTTTKAKSSMAKARAAKAKPAKAGPAKAAKPKGGSPVIGTLSLITIHVHDYDRALGFYRDTLELPEGEHMREAGWLEFETGPVKLGVHADPEGREVGSRPPGHPTGFYFNVEDCDKAVATLRQRGVKIVDEPADMPYGREATFHDPDGNLLAVLQPRA